MISVVIPMYNSEKTIINAIESVKNQTYKGDLEIIVVDDGSEDKSSEVVNHYITEHSELSIKLLQRTNGGVSAARNTGMKASKGELIALLDADDVWMPNKLERQLSFLENKNFDIDLLATKRSNHIIKAPYFVNENGLVEVTFRKLMIRNETSPPTVLFKRKILENTGYFDDEQRYAEDINYWLRVSLHNKIYILDEELILAGDGKRTFGVSGLSGNLKEMEKGFTKNLKDVYNSKRINFFEFLLYRVFYKAKYVFRLLRNQYLKLQGK